MRTIRGCPIFAYRDHVGGIIDLEISNVIRELLLETHRSLQCYFYGDRDSIISHVNV
jgi:hypothetical protein